VQIEQVLMNLVVNARDAMPDGGTLTIEIRNVLPGAASAAASPSGGTGPRVVLAITDTGVGMDGATLARVFDPFFTTKEPGKGTGLGLSTVFGIVKQSGGDVKVASVLGAGTTFTVSLPAASAEIVEAPSAPSPGALSNGTETILLVDDEPAVRAIAQRILERAGYTVLAAANGHDARTLLEGHVGVVALLLTDIIMPGMSGWQLAEQLVTIRPALRVLFASGYAGDAVLPGRRLEGPINFLAKPFSAATLTRKVRDVLDAALVPG
jgi:CheY-like chemotaxis protein